MFFSSKKKFSNDELNSFYDDVDSRLNEMKTQIKEDVRKEFYSKMDEKDNILKPEINILYTIIKILEDKEIITEDELDNIFKGVDPEDFEKLSNLYKIFIEKEQIRKKKDSDDDSEE